MPVRNGTTMKILRLVAIIGTGAVSIGWALDGRYAFKSEVELLRDDVKEIKADVKDILRALPR